MKKEKAITLISLVITIIILIILASIGIYLSLENNGIFTRAKYAKEKYNETAAKEKLELVLSEARIEKEINENYGEELLDSMLESSGMTVNGENVIVDNYNFEIDKENLIIVGELGKTQIKVIKQVEEYLGKNENDKYEANILLKVESNIEIEKVTIINPDETRLEIETENIQLGKNMTIEFDEEYIVEIVTKDGKTDRRKVVERTREEIKTTEELLKFRDKVNTGLTYEGKEINVLRNIDLSTVCGENINGEKVNWEPIGNSNATCFKGNLDGKNHKIKGLYFNDTSREFIGLFGIAQGSNIKNIIISSENSSINAKSVAGAIIGEIRNGVIENCINETNVTINDIDSVGGIAGILTGGIIKNCTNSGDISGYTPGGIVGYTTAMNNEDCEILNCINTGTISGKNNAGITSRAFNPSGKITIKGCTTTTLNIYATVVTPSNLIVEN